MVCTSFKLIVLYHPKNKKTVWRKYFSASKLDFFPDLLLQAPLIRSPLQTPVSFPAINRSSVTVTEIIQPFQFAVT
jgi:hypothetical protein